MVDTINKYDVSLDVELYQTSKFSNLKAKLIEFRDTLVTFCINSEYANLFHPDTKITFLMSDIQQLHGRSCIINPVLATCFVKNLVTSDNCLVQCSIEQEVYNSLKERIL